jgi:hypothetical protein
MGISKRIRCLPRDLAGFFEWQASGAVFEIESMEVTAGPMSRSHLLRCGALADFEPRAPAAADHRQGRRPVDCYARALGAKRSVSAA